MVKTLTNIHHVKQKLFDRNRLNNHSLILYIGRDELSYAIIHEAANEVVYLKAYRLTDSSNTNVFNQLLQKFFKQEAILQTDFVSVRVGVNAAHQTLVPTTYFDEKQVAQYFNFNYHYKPENFKVFHEKLSSSNIVNLYAIDKGIIQVLDRNLQSYKLKHSATFLIDQIIGVNRSADRKLFVNVQKHYLDITTVEGHKLLYHNTFFYETPNDFLYHIVNAAKHTGINLLKDKVILLGDINEDHRKFKLGKKYISNLKMSKRPITKNYCNELAVLPNNYHYNLFSIL